MTTAHNNVRDNVDNSTRNNVRSGWFFLRAYLLVVLLVVVVGVGLEALLMQRHEEKVRERESELLTGSFAFAELLYTQRSDEPPNVIAGQIAANIDLPATLLPLEDFTTIPERYDTLRRGGIIQLYDADDRVLFYRRLNESPWVLQLGPAVQIENERANWVVPLFYGLIALAVFVWIRPLMRDLASLEGTAAALGMQDFSARTDLPKGSWLYPLGDAFNGMAQRIESLLRSHRELTHAVSHELRTPLSRLRFGIEMVATGEEKDKANRLEAMQEDIDELHDLAEEMLGYAELEQRNLSAQRSILDPNWLEEYVAYYNRHTTALALTLKSVTATSVIADERLLRRALDNLVGNAQRYAKAHIEVSLSVRTGCYELTVADDGPGIDPARHEAVLSAYVREQSDGHKGFGLGLAIVKRAMDLHEGKVIIGTSELGGACITLSWPAGG